jgi:hypothetical protein
LALDGHEYFPSRSLSFNPVKYQTAGYTETEFILETMEERKYSLLPEISLIYHVFKAVTYSEKGQMLSAHLPNVQQAIWIAVLPLNELHKQINYSLINTNKMSHHSTFYFLFCHPLHVSDTFRVHHQEIK